MDADERKEKFIKEAKIVHAGENLDYSQVEYVNNRTPVKIIDRDLDENGIEYGEFWQTPSNHLKGQCHPKKRSKRISNTKSLSQEDVIQRFKDVHKGENLDYSQVKYVNMHTKVKIISHDLDENGIEYGEFWQEPVVHLKGCTHPRIAIKKQAERQSYSTESFIEKAKKVHCDDDYDYSFVNYKRSQEKIKIICNKTNNKGIHHGEFYICPDALLQGKGCPKCGNSISTAEDEIAEYIESLLGKNSVEKRNKKILDGMEIDIFVPSKNLGIEFNGIRWHSELFNKDRYYHLKKKNIAASKGVSLIHVFEDEYLTNKELVLDKIATILGVKAFQKKIMARKCYVAEISTVEAKKFLNKNHIQGFVRSSIYLGCFFDNELIAVMTFIKEKNNCWNLNRYCTNINYSCQGVAGKMLSYFENNYHPSKVKSFLDLRWCFDSENNLYTKLGFKKDSILKPDYRYTNGNGVRIHKFNFRKKKLCKKYNLPSNLTEKQLTEKIGYYRIWDCGLIKYVKEFV
jgi:hypothetical protein